MSTRERAGVWSSCAWTGGLEHREAEGGDRDGSEYGVGNHASTQPQPSFLRRVSEPPRFFCSSLLIEAPTA